MDIMIGGGSFGRDDGPANLRGDDTRDLDILNEYKEAPEPQVVTRGKMSTKLLGQMKGCFQAATKVLNLDSDFFDDTVSKSCVRPIAS